MDVPLHEVSLVVGLVLTVVAVSALGRAVRFPVPLLLVAVGVVGSLLPFADDFRPRPDLVLVVLLPPILYAAALRSSAIDIRHEIGPILSLSVGLVLATTIVVGVALHAAPALGDDPVTYEVGQPFRVPGRSLVLFECQPL